MDIKKRTTNIFTNNLKRLLNEKNKTQTDLSNDLGIPQSTMSNWMNGRMIPHEDKLIKIAEYFGVSPIELLFDHNDHVELSNNMININIYENILTKNFNLLSSIGTEKISVDQFKNGDFFAFKMNDDGMLTRIAKGDILIVRMQNIAYNNDVVIILINGREAICRKLMKTDSGIMLIPSNQNYETQFYNNDQINKLPITILGKVLEGRVKF